MRYLNDWIWLRLSNRYNVTSATHSLGDVYNRWVNETVGDLGVDLVDFYRQRIPDAESLNDAEYAFWAGGPLQDAVLWLDAQSVTSGHSMVPNLGSGGSVLNAQYGNGSTASTFPTLLEHTGQNYLYLPGVAGNYASTPDAAALDIAGDIDIRALVALDNWTTSLIRHAYAYKNGMFAFSSAGTMRLDWVEAGGANRAVQTSASLPFSAGQQGWVRVTVDVDNGAGGSVVSFQTSTDGVTWSVLENITNAFTTSFANSSSSLLLGEWSSNLLIGKFYRAQIRSGINGTVVFDADFTKLVNGSQTTFTEDSVNAATVTINRSTSGRKTVVVTRPVWLFGTDDYMEIVDNDLLDFGASDSFTVMSAMRQWATPPNYGRLIDKSNTFDTGWSLQNDATNAAIFGGIDDGPNQAYRFTQPFTLGQQQQVGLVVDRSAQTLVTFNGSTLSASASTTAVGSVANAYPVRIGVNATSATGFADMELFAVAVWRRALTAAEIAQVVQYYGLATAPSWAHLVLDENGVPILDESGDVIETE